MVRRRFRAAPGTLAVLSGLAVLTLALTACGGGGGSSAPCPPGADRREAAGGAVTVCAFDIRFDTKTITAPAGPLAITLINKGAIAHTLRVDPDGFELRTPKRHDTETGSVTLEAGTYEFVCTVPGHAQAGMKGEIVVS
jgi:nitrite reductase (NO-forming)